MEAREIERYLHEHIPLSREMEVGVVAVDERGVRLSAPLEPNINHRATVFGGSASALAILSAWTLVHVGVREQGYPSRIVIQRNQMEYLRPISGPFEAFCPMPREEEWMRFCRSLARRGTGRIGLDAQLLWEGEVAGNFHGVYVALGPPGGDS